MRQERTFTKVSPFTHKEHTMIMQVNPIDYEAWQCGMVIQKAMPYLTPDEREFLMTGITPEEWDATFKEE